MKDRGFKSKSENEQTLVGVALKRLMKRGIVERMKKNKKFHYRLRG